MGFLLSHGDENHQNSLIQYIYNTNIKNNENIENKNSKQSNSNSNSMNISPIPVNILNTVTYKIMD